MSKSRILNSSQTVLLVVDVQEAFRPAIGDFALAVSNISTVVRGFDILGLPVIVTEQYPEGLGKTVEEVAIILPAGAEVFEKTAFSAYAADGLADSLRKHAARQIVLCGFETHVCVNQSAHDLLEAGFEVHVLEDSVASRFSPDKNAGLEKMRSAGAVASSVELTLFELLRDSKHPYFKEIQGLIK